MAVEPPVETMHQQVMRLGRRIGIAIAGGAVTAVGIAGLALPVIPGIALVAVGLGILSLEFKQPRLLLARIKARGVRLKDQILHRRPDSGDD